MKIELKLVKNNGDDNVIMDIFNYKGFNVLNLINVIRDTEKSIIRRVFLYMQNNGIEITENNIEKTVKTMKIDELPKE